MIRSYNKTIMWLIVGWFIIGLLSSLIPAVISGSCSCENDPSSIAEAFDESLEVFKGELKEIVHEDSQDYATITFEVFDYYKRNDNHESNSSDLKTVYTATGDCGSSALLNVLAIQEGGSNPYGDNDHLRDGYSFFAYYYSYSFYQYQYTSSQHTFNVSASAEQDKFDTFLVFIKYIDEDGRAWIDGCNDYTQRIGFAGIDYAFPECVLPSPLTGLECQQLIKKKDPSYQVQFYTPGDPTTYEWNSNSVRVYLDGTSESDLVSYMPIVG